MITRKIKLLYNKDPTLWNIIFISFAIKMFLVILLFNMKTGHIDQGLYLSDARALYFDESARVMNDEGEVLYTHGIIYPAFLGFFLLVFGDSIFSLVFVRLFQVILSCFSVYFIYLISKKIFNKKVALICSIIAAFYPVLIAYNLFLITETFFIFFFLIFVYFFIEYIDSGKTTSLIIASLIIVICCLTRAISITFVPIVLLFILYKVIIEKKKRFIELVKHSAVFLTPLLLLVPVMINNYELTGKPVLDYTLGHALFWGNHVDYEPSYGWLGNKFHKHRWDIDYATFCDNMTHFDGFVDCQVRSELKWVRNNPVAFIKRIPLKFAALWNPTSFVGMFYKFGGYKIGGIVLKNNLTINIINLIIALSLILVVLFGIFGFVYSPNDKYKFFILFLIIMINFVHIMTVSLSRYRLMLIPLIAVYSAYGILNMEKIGWNLISIKTLIAVSIMLIFVICWIPYLHLIFF